MRKKGSSSNHEYLLRIPEDLYVKLVNVSYLRKVSLNLIILDAIRIILNEPTVLRWNITSNVNVNINNINIANQINQLTEKITEKINELVVNKTNIVVKLYMSDKSQIKRTMSLLYSVLKAIHGNIFLTVEKNPRVLDNELRNRRNVFNTLSKSINKLVNNLEKQYSMTIRELITRTPPETRAWIDILMDAYDLVERINTFINNPVPELNDNEDRLEIWRMIKQFLEKHKAYYALDKLEGD